jgi:hypothetical protein
MIIIRRDPATFYTWSFTLYDMVGPVLDTDPVDEGKQQQDEANNGNEGLQQEANDVAAVARAKWLVIQSPSATIMFLAMIAIIFLSVSQILVLFHGSLYLGVPAIPKSDLGSKRKPPNSHLVRAQLQIYLQLNSAIGFALVTERRRHHHHKP